MTTRLGSTTLDINPLVFGTLPLGPLQANLPPEEAGRIIRHAVDRGVNLLDTAELYGTYPHIRRALEGCSAPVAIATKTHANNATTARAHVERALQELGREHLEIVHLHGARVKDPFTERREVLDELLRMKEEGKIGHVGLSSHYICAVTEAAAHPEIEVVHPLINRTGMGILDGSAEEMAAAIARCAAAGKGIYAMKALAGGNLIPEARQSLRWVLDLPGVHGLAIGMLSTEEVNGNLALFAGEDLDPTVWETLESRRRRIRIMENFCKICGSCVPACPSGALSVDESAAQVDEDLCVLCGYCAASCPEFIIRVV